MTTLTTPVAAGDATTVADCPVPLGWKAVLQNVREQSRTLTVERDGAVLTGRSLGSGPSIYLLKSVWGNWELFALSMWLLRDDFRVVVIDAPEHLPARRLQATAFAEDLFAVADEFGDERFSLFATSFGCTVALRAAMMEQDRISGMILHAGFSMYRLGRAERLLLSVGRLLKRPLSRLPLFARIQTENHRQWFPPFDGSRFDFLLDNIGRTSTRAALRRLAALRNTKFSMDELAAISCPILSLGCEGDDLRGRVRRSELAAMLPGAIEDELPNAGHFPYLTHPHLFANSVKAFLGTLPPSL